MWALRKNYTVPGFHISGTEIIAKKKEKDIFTPSQNRMTQDD